MRIPVLFEYNKKVQVVLLNDRETFTASIHHTNEAGVYLDGQGTVTFYPWHRVSHMTAIK